MINMASTIHPYYNLNSPDWMKWRLTYQGGEQFIDHYLKRYSAREDQADFESRKDITYCPAFAKSAIEDVKNSIYQRMCDITRVEGSDSYRNSVKGLKGGVNLKGATMNSFIGTEVLPELLTMQRVGIYIDMPRLEATDLASNVNKHPYLYIYRVEQIRNWVQAVDGTYESVVLEDTNYRVDEETGFPESEYCRYRYIRKENGKVVVTMYDNENNIESEEILNLTEIPFVCVEVSNSLLCDIADYQIALLNLASSDMGYALKSNFPFYVEQYDHVVELAQQSMKSIKNLNGDSSTEVASTRDINLGVSHGRRYPKELDAPSFISPSAEPLKASMEKQDQLKKEIRQILNLNISNITVPRASAESKRMDSVGLESGLAYIGLALEIAENRIAAIWAQYEGNANQFATIRYPDKYELRSEGERIGEAKELADLIEAVPSRTYQKQIAQRIADTMLGGKTTVEVMEKIYKEIASAKAVSIVAKDLISDVENGLVSRETASELRGYPKDEAEKANKEHAERLKIIQESQTPPGENPGARGNPDGSANPGPAARMEKVVNKDKQQTPKDPTRGEGKNNGSVP